VLRAQANPVDSGSLGVLNESDLVQELEPSMQAIDLANMDDFEAFNVFNGYDDEIVFDYRDGVLDDDNDNDDDDDVDEQEEGQGWI
jgi:hypothetical protein